MIFEWGVSGEGLIQSTSNSYISEKQEKSYFPWREHKRLHFAFAPADTSINVQSWRKYMEDGKAQEKCVKLNR